MAGLRAAVSLADAGERVTLLESRIGLGGRARSFTDPATGEVIDNGQHLLLAGYRHTLSFFDRLGTSNRILFQERLKVSFVSPGGGTAVLDCPPAPAPWHMILGIFRFSGLPWKERLSLGRVWHELGLSGGRRDRETVRQWLDRLGQGQRSRELFWDPLTIAALNESPEKAGAAGLKRVLKTMMAEPWPNARLGMATVGLSDLYSDQARRVIEGKGGQIHLNRPAAGFETDEDRILRVRFADGTSIEADAVISTLPPLALLKILPEIPLLSDLAHVLRRFESSPILSINLWLDKPVTQELFVAMIGCRFQWLFNKQAMLRLAGIRAGYVSLIASAAYDLLDRPNEELVRIALQEIEACFLGVGPLKPTRTQVVRERDATVSLTPETEKLRPVPKTPMRNLFLAGDWTATGLPATIESAVLSGELAASAVLAS